MATQKSIQPTCQGAVEALLGEITTEAYFTEILFQNVDGTDGNQIDQIHALCQVIARMGWMADLALHRLGSINCMREGRAQDWLLSPLSFKLLSEEK